MAQESVLRIVIDSRNAERNAQNIARELQSIERNGDHASRSMDSMSVATRSLVGYMSGLVTIGAAINKMDTYIGLTNKLKLVTVNQTELNKAMGDTFKIAQNTAQAWDSVAQIYQRFSDNAKRLNITQAETASLTETVAKAISISGGSAASAEAALIQFSQALASNVLRGEELNSVMEQAPGLAKAIAQGMGITVGQLRSVAAEGKITGDVLVEALGKAKASVDDLFSKTDFTIAQSFTQLSNEVTKFVGEAGKSSGAANALSGSIKVLAENLELIANGAFVIGIGYATKAIAAKTVAIYSSIVATTASIEAEKVSAAQTLRSALAEKTAAEAELTRARDAVVSAEMQVQADRKVIASEMQRIESSLAQVAAEKQLEIQRLKSQINDQGRIATSTRMAELQQVQASMTAELTVLERQLGATTVASSAQFVAAREAQVVATGNLAATTEVATLAQAQNNAVQRAGLLTSTGLVGALGGPLGLGITVAALAATYLMFKDSSDDVNDSLSSQIEVVSDLAQKYRELTLAKLISEQDALEKKLKNSESQSSKAIASLMGVATATEHSTDKQKKQSEEMNRIATSLRGGAITTGKALIQMRESGFTEAQIKKASAFFDEFDKGKAGANEAGRQIDYVSQQTGIYGDKLDASTKKIADQKAIVNALSGDYKNLSDEMGKNIDWLLQQDGALSATAEQQKKVTDAVDAWKKGTIDATSVAKVFKANLPIDSSLLTGLDGLAIKTDKAKKELNTANGELKQVQANGPKAKQGFADAATGAKDAESEVGKLNEKLKDFNKTLYDRDFDANFKKMALERTKLSEKEIQAVMEVAQELRKKGVALDSDAAKQLYAEAVRITKIEEQGNKILDDRNEAEKKITKEKEKQAKLAEKTIKSMTIDSVIAKGEGNYNSVNLGKKYGYKSSTRDLESMSVGQVLSAQQKKEFNAAGKYQFLPSTLQGAIDAGIVSVAEKFNADVQERIVQQYLLTAKKGRGNVENYITGKSDNLTAANLDISKEFASVASPFTGKSYHGGVANNKARISVDDAQNALKASRELYAQAIASGKSAQDAWKAAFNGSISFVDGSDLQKDLDKFVQDNLKKQEEIKQLQSKYDTEAITRGKARDEEILQANILGQTALIPKIKERYDAEDKLAKLQQEFDVEGHKWTEERKLQYTYETNVERLTAEGKFSEEQKKIFEKGLKEQYEQEKAFAILARETRIFQYKQALMTEAELVRERYRIEMLELSKLDIEERRIAMQAKTTALIRGNLAPVGTPIIESDKGKSNTQLLQEETGRELLAMQNRHLAAQVAAKDNAEELLRIEREYIAAKEQLHAQHDIKLVDARQADYESQLQLYGQMLSQVSGVWGDMTNMIKESSGEQSKTYKAMFLMQQMFAIGSALVSTHLAATQAMAAPDMVLFGQKIAASSAIMALGYANVGLIAGQTIAGMAHNGIDNIPKEGTWLLDKGERVLNPQQNQDFTTFLKEQSSATKRVGVGTLDAINSGKSLGGDVVVQPQIIINVPQGFTAEKSEDSNGVVTIDIMKKIAREESRKAIKSDANNPNSDFSKAMGRNFNAPRKRN